MTQEKHYGDYYPIKEEFIEWKVFSLAKLNVFTDAELAALKQLGIENLASLQSFRNKISDIISDICKIEGFWNISLTREEQICLLALKVIKDIPDYFPSKK